MKHIFTCNLPQLERESDELFKEFQETVDMVVERNPGRGRSGRCFYYTSGSSRANWMMTMHLAPRYSYVVEPVDAADVDSSMVDPGLATWETAPKCISEARNFMIECATVYGVEDVSMETVRCMEIQAWMEGSTTKVFFHLTQTCSMIAYVRHSVDACGFPC